MYEKMLWITSSMRKTSRMSMTKTATSRSIHHFMATFKTKQSISHNLILFIVMNGRVRGDM
jgi:hypothetical protein